MQRGREGKEGEDRYICYPQVYTTNARSSESQEPRTELRFPTRAGGTQLLETSLLPSRVSVYTTGVRITFWTQTQAR